MRLEDLKQYAPLVLRVGISLVLLWFGLNQIFDSASWIGYLPPFVGSLPINAQTFLMLNGSFEVLIGGLLLVGLFTRIAAVLIAIQVFGIMITLGYNEIAVRDFGLSLAAASIFLHGPDKWCLDKKLRK